MFLWFEIEKNAHEWNNLLEAGYEYLFNSHAYLLLNKPGKSSLAGIVNENFRMGGLLHQDKQCFECFIFPLNITADVLNELLKWLKAQGVSKVIFNSFAHGSEKVGLPNGVHSTTKRIEFIADGKYCENLSKSSLHSTHRRTINKLERSNVQLIKIERFFFIHLAISHVTKIIRKPDLYAGIRRFLKELLYIYQLSKLIKLHDEFMLYSVIEKKKILSSAVILQSGNVAYYMLGASRSCGYKTRASVYLMWSLLNKYCKEGIEFNMGGVNISTNSDEGVYRFKKQFGLEEHERKSFQVKL